MLGIELRYPAVRCDPKLKIVEYLILLFDCTFSHLCSVQFNTSDTQTFLGVFIVQKCVESKIRHCKNHYRGILHDNSPS